VLLGLLNSERFADAAPAAVYATLLDEGCYHGSIRTMVPVVGQPESTGERRRQRVHPVYAKPGAARDPTRASVELGYHKKIKGAVKWETYQLYVIMDILAARRRLDAGCTRIG